MKTPFVIMLILSGVSGVLLWACYFPLNVGPLVFAALVPLCLLIWADAKGWKVAAASYVGGLAFFAPATSWMRVAHPMMVWAWVALSLYCALYVTFAVLLTRKMARRGVPAALAFPVVWVALEYVREWMLGGFAWYYLAHALHDESHFIQAADLAGCYGVSLVVALVNVAAAGMIASDSRVAGRLGLLPSGRRAGFVWAGAAAAGVAGLFAYGYVKLDHEPYPAGPTVGLVQGDVAQDVRNTRNSADEAAAIRAAQNMLAHHVDLSVVAAEKRPDLVVWPETSYPRTFYVLGGDRPEAVKPDRWELLRRDSDLQAELFGKFARRFDAELLLGLNTKAYAESGTKSLRYNSALRVTSSGPTAQVYSKVHRVPFGEYVPFRETLPFMKNFSPYDYDYDLAPGPEMTRFNLPYGDNRIASYGVLICYEDSDPQLLSDYVSSAGSVDFFVNISNDGWFKRTAEHDQHLAICRFRAVESRRSVVRAVNMGISAVIGPDGGIVALPEAILKEAAPGRFVPDRKVETWHDAKQGPAVVVSQVPLCDAPPTLYMTLGPWLPWLCWAVILVVLFVGYVRRRGRA